MILELMVTSDVPVVRVDRQWREGSLYCKYSKGGRHPYPFERVGFQTTEESSQAFSISRAVR